MAQFIERDYLTPVIARHNVKISLKNLWRKIQSTSIDGTTFYAPMFFKGGLGTAPWQYPSESDGIRDDPEFKRFMKTIGSSRNDLFKENYTGTTAVYFYLDPRKLVFTPQNALIVKTKLNDYLSPTLDDNVSIHPIYYYACNKVVADVVAELPADVVGLSRYTFLVGGAESSLTEDGYFRITYSGVIRITQLGIDNGMHRFRYTDSNSGFYTIKKVLTDNTFTTENITLSVSRKYVDIRITVGGSYRAKIAGETNWIIADNTSYNLEPITFLSEVRTAVEANPAAYLGNMRDITDNADTAPLDRLSDIVSDKGSLLGAVGSIEYDRNSGHVFDTLALLDTDTNVSTRLFEVVNPVFNEVVSYEETTPGSGIYNLSYTYSKRYRINAIATEVSPVVVKCVALGALVKKSLDAINTSNTGLPTSLHTASTIDTTMTEAVYQLHDIGLNDATMFNANGGLLVAAFEAMTPTAFASLFAKCLEIGYIMEESEWWEKVLAVVIIIIAAVIFYFSGGTSWVLSEMMVAAALSMAFLVVAGSMYAKHVGDAWGMKLIGKAIQVNGIALAVMAIMNGYADINSGLAALEGIGEISTVVISESATTTLNTVVNNTMIGIATSTVSVASSTVSLAGQLGMGVDDDITAILGLIGTSLALYTSNSSIINEGFKSMSNESLASTAFRNVGGFVENLQNGVKAYMAFQELVQGTEDAQYTKDQGEIESMGVERAYLLQEKVYANDALSNFDTALQGSFGLAKTEMILAKQMW